MPTRYTSVSYVWCIFGHKSIFYRSQIIHLTLSVRMWSSFYGSTTHALPSYIVHINEQGCQLVLNVQVSPEFYFFSKAAGWQRLISRHFFVLPLAVSLDVQHNSCVARSTLVTRISFFSRVSSLLTSPDPSCDTTLSHLRNFRFGDP